MRIGILGTGTLAEGLGRVWVQAGHELVVSGRSRARADALAEKLGGPTRAATPREAVTGRDAVLLAVLWAGVEDILRDAGAADGSLAGTPLIDPSNAVEHGVGVLLTEPGSSAAERIAALAPGAHVVKALHLFAADQWTARPAGDGHDGPAPTVAICGDEAAALRVTSELIRSLGGVPAVLGPLARARQLEEVAGFVIGLAFAGVDPASAVPHVPAGQVTT
ncbi:NADPH-dependent F420 reductase [Frankia sp. AgB32]|uniref:NADPH-dependent F420 reductase n=1 Tax=Frankia sp. AgB32 TaxID=631119 RepID=UPI0020106C85|nr:NAD(P)-binding domain-containing protein [Frankia sp. AgB32]MCK9895810.1 NAD(P)-binding domain-containing protein [Frankia sp. AgB32]